MGLVLDGWGHDVQAKLVGGAFAGNARPGRVGGGQAGAFGIAGHRTPLRMGQVLGEPGLALCQGLGVGQHHLDALGAVAQAHQVVAHQQADFAHHMHGGAQKQIKRPCHHTFAGVFHAHHAKLRRSSGGGVEHFVKVSAVVELHRAAKKFDRGLFAKSALRAQHRDALRRFQGEAGGHDFAPDGGHMAAVQGARVQVLDFLQHLRHPVGAEKRRAFAFFDLTHLLGHPRALVEQVQQLFVQRVNLVAQRGQVGRGHRCGGLAHGVCGLEGGGAWGLSVNVR